MATLIPAKTMRVETLTGRIQEGLPASQIMAVDLTDFSCTFLTSTETGIDNGIANY